MSTFKTWAKTHEIKGKMGTLLFIYLQPGASKSQIKGEHDGKLKLSLQAPPVDGAANEALIQFFSQILNIQKSKIHLVQGKTSRQKTLWIESNSTKIIELIVAILPSP